MKIPLKQYGQLLFQYLRPQWLSALLLAVLLFGNIALQLISPQIIRSFIDSALAGAAMAVLTRLALWFMSLALIQQIVSVVARYLSENIAWKATNTLRADLADHCLRLDLSFHNAHTPGEMIERLDGDVTALSNFFSQFLIYIASSAVLLVGILVLLFREDWRVGLAMSIFALIVLVVMGRFRDIAVPHWTAERQASADLFGFLEERLAGTEDIRSNGAEAFVMRRFYELMRLLMKRSLKAGMMINLLMNTTFLLFAAGNATAFAISAVLYQRALITIGTVYLIFFYTNMLDHPINALIHEVQDLQKAGAGITRIQELLGIHSKIREKASTADLLLSNGNALAVVFQNVTFGYDDNLAKNGKNGSSKSGSNGNALSVSPAAEVVTETDKVTSQPGGNDHQKADQAGTAQPGGKASEQPKEIVLKNVSFRLQPGTVLGLLGRTGSGKTTLTRLLFRFYDPDQGCIQIGSTDSADDLVDLQELPRSLLRSQVGMVTQNIQLFNASVRDNLTFFDRSISDRKILDVSEALGLGEWFKKLPKGLDTVLDSNGSGLSAGEAQLLAFMRIFLRDPGLVVLDEASSRLDPATEALIERAVERLVQNRTAIIIAHRLGTVQRADEIMVLENGQVLEYGGREQLAADPESRFYSLLQTGMEEVLV
jgi:ABC-type multidrug transport system fused ATPase/permease subunit